MASPGRISVLVKLIAAETVPPIRLRVSAMNLWLFFMSNLPGKKLHGGYFAAQLAYKQRADEAHVSCEFLERVGVIDSKGSRQREIVYDVGVAGCIVDSVPQ
jgi:hypothetical protein